MYSDFWYIFLRRTTEDRGAAKERSKEERKAWKVPAEEGNGGKEKDAATSRGVSN